MRDSAPDWRTWTRRLLSPLAQHAQPPERVESFASRGLHLVLNTDRGHRLHLCLSSPAQTPEAYYRSDCTALRYLGERDPGPLEQDWLSRVCEHLPRVEALDAWPEILKRAVDKPARTMATDPTGGKVTSGEQLLVRITGTCNANCAFCSARGLMPDLVEGLGAVRERLAQSAAVDGDVAFTGGEPTLVRDLPEMIRAAVQLGYRDRCVQTNGVTLARPSRLDRLVDAGMSSIFLSLHSASAEVHDAMLGLHGAHAKALVAARACLDRELVVGINCVLSRENLAGAPDLVALIATRLGVDKTHLCLSYCSPQGWALDHPDLTPSLTEVAGPLAAALDAAKKVGLWVRVPGLCGVPMCLLPDHLESFDEYHADQPALIRSRTFGPACTGCRLRSRCSGFWKVYLDRHGPLELDPSRLDGVGPERDA